MATEIPSDIAQLMADMKLGREHTITFPDTATTIPRKNLTVCNLAALNFSRAAFAIVVKSKGSIWTDVVPKLVSSQTIEVRLQSAVQSIYPIEIFGGCWLVLRNHWISAAGGAKPFILISKTRTKCPCLRDRSNRCPRNMDKPAHSTFVRSYSELHFSL